MWGLYLSLSFLFNFDDRASWEWGASSLYHFLKN